MRQLLIQVPRGCGFQVIETAKAFDGANLALLEATGSEGTIDLAIIHISNSKVEGLLGELASMPQLHVTLIPQGVMALQPPPEEAPQQVTTVEHAAPLKSF